MHPELVKLLDLQEKDLTLLEIDTRLAEVLAEEAELDAAVDRAGEAGRQARRAAEQAARQRDEYEQRIATLKQQHERRQQRLEFVRNPKEASTLMAELDLARGVLAREEGDWVKLADQVKASELRATQVEAEVDQVRAGQAEARAELDARKSAIAEERRVALEAREASAKAVERGLRTRYDRLRGPRRPRVLVPLNGGACSACNTAIPVSRRSAVKGGSVIEACQNCGAILYWAE
ncbi:MAG TPA: C4-type zinc ribbon domain-containing protein [Gemmatimonadales bacterium]|nr:C4-type zinc ribbon domain-containing protein [Gemmatimonadales bacterium]